MFYTYLFISNRVCGKKALEFALYRINVLSTINSKKNKYKQLFQY